MKDIFNDQKFNEFLYGGVRDLDEDIGNIVYSVYKSKLVDTTWSCSGHIDTSLLDVGRSTRPGTHYVYQFGVFLFNEGQTQNSPVFLCELTDLVGAHHFANLRKPSELTQYYALMLEMKDLVDDVNHPREVAIPLARQRYSEFKIFWSKLLDIAEKLK